MSSKQPLSNTQSWLASLLTLRPARWQWSRALRATVTVGLPFAVGLALGDIMTGMWIAMGTLMMSTGETSGAYGGVLRRLAIGAPMGAVGYLAGYLTGLPWAGTVAAMAAIAFGVGLLSRRSSALSIGGLQLLLTASIAIGVPAIAPFWEPALLYLVGAALYGAWVGVEGLIRGQQPRREQLTHVLAALASLADARAAGQPADAARRQATTALDAFADDLPGRGQHSDEVGRLAAAALPVDALFAAVLATDDPAALQAASRQLRLFASAVAEGGWPASPSLPASSTALDAPLLALGQVLTGHAPAATPAHLDTLSGLAVSPHGATAVPAPGRDGMSAALALALCIGIAYATHWFNHAGHWFWVPLTVGLVMKPDLGSIFARALLRCIGAVAGVALGALILTLVPKGYVFILIMALLAGLLPWAMQRSYALQAVVLTPLILMLVDVIMPGSGNADFAMQRLVDTVIGGVIVMIFGYLLWPRRGGESLVHRSEPARQAVANHLRAVLAASAAAGPLASAAGPARGQAYRQLASWRASLQKALSDPPPACTQAAAQLQQVDPWERRNDAITRYSILARLPVSDRDRAVLEALASTLVAAPLTGPEYLASDPAWGEAPETSPGASSPPDLNQHGQATGALLCDDPATAQLAEALAGSRVTSA